MCGILGFALRPGAAPMTRAEVESARDRMAQRGPDDHGVVELDGGRVWLAHRRLSILDLSAAGRQPMRHGGRDLWTTYNGEIYNFAALRAPLTGTGETFRSRTDTEVLLAAYTQLGDGCLGALRGMFAFAIWDGERRRMLLARDRIGKKPLYYAETERGVAFSSTIDALISSGFVEPSLRTAMLPEYLATGHVAAPDTLLEGVFKVPPGGAMEIRDGVITARWRYHETGDVEPDPRPATFDRRLEETLTDAVRLRLVADVPVGITLSGGVDSSLVAGLAARIGTVPLRTFTVTFGDDEAFNEGQYARAVADHLGAEHFEVSMTSGLVAERLAEAERFVDEPHPNPIWIATYFVCQLAREQGVPVVLTGDGGDELFFGYSRWTALWRAYRRYLRPMGALPGPLRGLAYAGVRTFVRDEPRRELFRRAASREPIYWGPMLFHRDALSNLMSARGREVLHRRPPVTRSAGWQAKDGDASFAESMRRNAIRGHLVEDYLARLDRMGMAVSVEGRAPLLDQEIVKLAMSCPPERMIAGHLGKTPLRRLLAKLFPARLVDRPKMGFGAPLHSWLRGALADVARDSLEGLADELDVFDGDAVERLRNAPAGDLRTAQRAWGLVTLARWWRRMRALAPARIPASRR